MNLNVTMFGQCISFIIFIWFCMQYIWPNIINMIEKRKKEIAISLSNLEKSKKNLEMANINAKKIFNESKKKADLIIQEANKNKIIMIEETKLLAEKEKKRIILQANTEINIKKEKIKHELIKKISLLAINISKKIVKGSITNKKNYDNLIHSMIIDL